MGFSWGPHGGLIGRRQCVNVTNAEAPPRDVVYVLCLLQAAFVLLGAAGEVLLMGGNGAYLVVPVAKLGVLLWLAAKIVSGRRWAMITMIVLQSITLAGFALQVLLSVVPAVGLTVNLTGLVSNVLLPIVMIVLSVRSMPVKDVPPPTEQYAVPQDPYAPAPLVDESATLHVLSRPTGTQSTVEYGA